MTAIILSEIRTRLFNPEAEASSRPSGGIKSVKLSTKARYAVRALIVLALKNGQEPVKLRDIAESQDISLKYLEQVMFPLRTGGYVRTLKGSRGGYILARESGEITLLEIVQCVEGSLSPVDCANHPDICKRSQQCAAREAWVGLKDAIYNELGRTTLAKMAARQKVLNGMPE